MKAEPLLLILILGLVASGVEAAEPGSLIDADRYRGLAADRRAYRIGDTLTVTVAESARAESRAGTERSRNVRVDANARDGAGRRDVGIGLAGRDDGLGGTRRSGELRAQLTVAVLAIEPNGHLRVGGEQSIVVNGETQTIVLTGLVRSEDVGPDNTVLSSRLSQAAIEFTGAGDVSATQRRSVVTRIMNWLGLI